jgi:hypothetical protein
VRELVGVAAVAVVPTCCHMSVEMRNTASVVAFEDLDAVRSASPEAAE